MTKELKLFKAFLTLTSTANAFDRSPNALYVERMSVENEWEYNIKRGVTYCNPSSISTGGALYWTLWVLLSSKIRKRSHTEVV